PTPTPTPTSSISSRRVHESPSLPSHSLAGTSTPQLSVTVRKYRAPNVVRVHCLPEGPTAAHRIVNSRANAAASANEPDSSASWVRTDGGGKGGNSGTTRVGWRAGTYGAGLTTGPSSRMTSRTPTDSTALIISDTLA